MTDWLRLSPIDWLSCHVTVDNEVWYLSFFMVRSVLKLNPKQNWPKLLASKAENRTFKTYQLQQIWQLEADEFGGWVAHF